MKLFLSSVSVTPELLPFFIKLVGKEPADIQFCLIENGADVYAEEDRGFVERESNALEAVGLKLSRVDLRDYFKKEGLTEALKDFDVIWLGGGNTYYLRWALRESGFDEISKNLLDKGITLAGGSAGALVLGPTLEGFEIADEPDKAPSLINEGLGLVDFVPVPHWNNEKFGHVIAQVKTQLDEAGVKSMTITDEQAIVVNGAEVKLAP
jgi:dipeptidase E